MSFTKRPLATAVMVAFTIALGAAFWGAHTFTEGGAVTAKSVPTVPAKQVLAWIGEGKRIIFVDAREAEEFDEEHIPGAINLSLRELEQVDPKRFGEADLIVAYCMKDFRGYEVAKALRRAGFPQSAIIREYGLAGWKKQGLPTVTPDTKSEQLAESELAVCAKAPERCLKSKG